MATVIASDADNRWRLTTDRDTGLQYWYHEETGETKWLADHDSTDEDEEFSNPLNASSNLEAKTTTTETKAEKKTTTMTKKKTTTKTTKKNKKKTSQLSSKSEKNRRGKKEKFCNDKCATNALIRSLMATTLLLLGVLLWLSVRVSSKFESKTCPHIVLSKTKSEDRLNKAFQDEYNSMCKQANHRYEDLVNDTVSRINATFETALDSANEQFKGTDAHKDAAGGKNSVRTFRLQLQARGISVDTVEGKDRATLAKKIAQDLGDQTFNIRVKDILEVDEYQGVKPALLDVENSKGETISSSTPTPSSENTQSNSPSSSSGTGTGGIQTPYPTTSNFIDIGRDKSNQPSNMSFAYTVEGANITFSVRWRGKGWFAFGVSSSGGMAGSDVAICHDGNSHAERFYLKDQNTPSNGTPIEGSLCEVSNGNMTMSYTRPLAGRNAGEVAIVLGQNTSIAFASGGSQSISFHTVRGVTTHKFAESENSRRLENHIKDPDQFGAIEIVTEIALTQSNSQKVYEGIERQRRIPQWIHVRKYLLDTLA